MTTAIATAACDATEGLLRLVVKSIGTANPGQVASVAVGLGVPVPQVMEAMYRAPTVLVDGLPPEIANQIADLLDGLGCEVCVEGQAAPPPAAAPLFDVAMHITDTTRYRQIVAALAKFLGCTGEDAAQIVNRPPAIVLGKVSLPTIRALADRLGEGAALVQSNPVAAAYDLFIGDMNAAVRGRLLADLRRRDLALQGESGCIATGLDRVTADAIWATHGRIPALRIVNRDFLRFDVVLTGGTPSPAAEAALMEVAGIPAHVIPRLFDASPITVIEALPTSELASAIEALAATGLKVRADLVTFLHLGVDILSCTAPSGLAETLAALGIEVTPSDLRRLPCRLPVHLPELEARLLRDVLAVHGAEVSLFDPQEAAA